MTGKDRCVTGVRMSAVWALPGLSEVSGPRPSPRRVLTPVDCRPLEDPEAVLHYYVNQPVREGVFRAKETFLYPPLWPLL